MSNRALQIMKGSKTTEQRDQVTQELLSVYPGASSSLPLMRARNPFLPSVPSWTLLCRFAVSSWSLFVLLSCLFFCNSFYGHCQPTLPKPPSLTDLGGGWRCVGVGLRVTPFFFLSTVPEITLGFKAPNVALNK